MSFESLLGQGSAARQLLIYGVGYEIARSLLGPMFTQVEYLINSGSPIVELSPPDLANLIVRGFIADDADAQARAAKFGLSPENFKQMVDLAGEPPGLQEVLQWWRRGFIPTDSAPTEPSLSTAVRTSRVYTYWLDTIIKGQLAPPSPAALVNAAIRNQIAYEDAVKLAFHGGLGSPPPSVPDGAPIDQTEYAFKILFDAAGRPPSFTELAELVYRGVIPDPRTNPMEGGPNPSALTFEQGIYEGDLKDKWEPAMQALLERFPPFYDMRILLESGSVTQTEVDSWVAKQGYSPEVSKGLAAYASGQRVAGSKQLTESMIVTLYQTQMLDQATATTLLGDLGYDDASIALILSLTDAQRALSAVNASINRVGAYYIAHKVNTADAQAALARLGVPDAQAQQLVQTWDVDRTSNIKLLTAAEIYDGMKYAIFDQATAQSELEALGYTPHDAWAYLSIHNKAPLPDEPAPGPAGIA